MFTSIGAMPEVGNVGNLVLVRRLKTVEKAVVGFQSADMPTVYVIWVSMVNDDVEEVFLS
jgi:hypothetical protein